MAYIPYLSEDEVPEGDRVPDSDHIMRIHSVHPASVRPHFDLYVQLMRKAGPLARIQREMIAVSVSAANHCHY
jgi:alkylhydroperoxidase family enzyme